MRGFGATLTLLLATTILIAGVALLQGWTSRIEAFVFVTGAVCVWLTARENIWSWPIGLLNSAACAKMFYEGQLLADGVLNGIYFVLGVFGWYWWLHGGRDKTQVRIQDTPRKEWGLIFAIAIVVTGALTLWLYQHSDVAPFLDAATSVFSLVAQYLLTRKYIESWLFWIAVDIVYVPLYAWKGWYLTALLYSIFLVMAVGGLREWARLRAEQTGSAPFVPAWLPVQASLALGAVAAAWMGWRCWQFEHMFSSETLAAIRGADAATLAFQLAGEPVTSVPVPADKFPSLKAELLDPLRYTRQNGRLPDSRTKTWLALEAAGQPIGKLPVDPSSPAGPVFFNWHMLSGWLK